MTEKTPTVKYPPIVPIGRNKYKVYEDYSYTWEKDGQTYKMVVPQGFINNLASIPRFLWWYISPFDLGAAVIHHDWIYTHSGKIPSTSFFKLIDGKFVEIESEWTRKNADRLFCRMMRETDNVSKFKRRNAFRAVRIFGWWAFHKKEIIKKFRKLINKKGE